MIPPGQARRYDVHAEGDKRIIFLAGELDMTGAALLEDLLIETIRGAATVEVDLRSVAFIDSSVVRVLTTASHTARGDRRAFTVTNPRGHVQRVLDITGVLPILTVDETAAEGSTTCVERG